MTNEDYYAYSFRSRLSNDFCSTKKLRRSTKLKLRSLDWIGLESFGLDWIGFIWIWFVWIGLFVLLETWIGFFVLLNMTMEFWCSCCNCELCQIRALQQVHDDSLAQVSWRAGDTGPEMFKIYKQVRQMFSDINFWL